MADEREDPWAKGKTIRISMPKRFQPYDNDRLPTWREVVYGGVELLPPTEWRVWTDEKGDTHRERLPQRFVPRNY